LGKLILEEISTGNENQSKSPLCLVWVTIFVSKIILSSFPFNQHFRRVVASMSLKIFQNGLGCVYTPLD